MLSLPELGVYFSLLLFLVGLFGVMCRKGILLMMLSIEIMLNAANLAFVSASVLTNTMDGQVIMFFVMAVAACEAGVGLALVVSIYRARATVETDDLRMLRG
ncbi:MAG: NADH-quinone oxidoreductase subunit NuoK [Bdellovibrionota bacterium]